MVSKKALLYSVTDMKISALRVLDAETYQIENQMLVDRAIDRCTQYHVVAMTADDKDYHFKYSLISNSPYVIYMIGNTDLLNKSLIAMVGPRKHSPYATQVMESLFQTLAQYDVVTISGMADGVDKLCHDMSMVHGVPTIAVLGGGLKYYLESREREYIQKILDAGGLIISEFKLNNRPEKYTFPQRNRIVAGLSDMVFLPEASEKSGSLITVDFARGMHKDVYGAPNTLFSPTSQGLHQYMQHGLVTPVVDWGWMLSKYFGKKINNYKGRISNGKGSLFEGEVSLCIEILQKNPAGLKLDALVSQTGLGVEEVMSQLTMAEVMGQVMNDGGVWRVR